MKLSIIDINIIDNIEYLLSIVIENAHLYLVCVSQYKIVKAEKCFGKSIDSQASFLPVELEMCAGRWSPMPCLLPSCYGQIIADVNPPRPKSIG